MLGLGLGLNDHVHATLCPLQDLHTFRAWISMARTNRFLKIQWTQSAFGCSSTEWRLFLVYTVWRLGHPNINHSLFHCFPYLLVGEHPDTSTPICFFSLFDSCNPSGQEPLLDRSWEAPKKGVLTSCKGSVVGGSTKKRNVAGSNPSEPSTKKYTVSTLLKHTCLNFCSLLLEVPLPED